LCRDGREEIENVMIVKEGDGGKGSMKSVEAEGWTVMI
jgi:hypothetical protein